LSLTSEGRQYYARSGGLLAELDDIERELTHGAGHASGTVRINASVAFGVLGIEPLVEDAYSDAEEVHALYLGEQRLPQRVRSFLNFMVPRLQAFIVRGMSDYAVLVSHRTPD
jgi:hypothetical protein